MTLLKAFVKAVQGRGLTPPSPETELRPLTTHAAQDKVLTGGGARFPGFCKGSTDHIRHLMQVPK